MPLFIRKSCWQQDITKGEYIKGIVLAFLVTILISYVFYRRIFTVLFLSPIGFLYFRLWHEEREKKKKHSFQWDFKEAMQIISSNLSVGYSFENAIIKGRNELGMLYHNQSRIIKELDQVIKMIDLNVPIEEALSRFAEKNPIEETKNFVTIFISVRKSGGNLVEVIGNTVSQIADKQEVEKEIQTIMAAKKFEFKIMTVIPFFIIFYMTLSFQEFMDPLYNTYIGIGAMTLCLGVYIMAYYLGLRILKIEI